jgi:hypothetical protein
MRYHPEQKQKASPAGGKPVGLALLVLFICLRLPE